MSDYEYQTLYQCEACQMKLIQKRDVMIKHDSTKEMPCPLCGRILIPKSSNDSPHIVARSDVDQHSNTLWIPIILTNYIENDAPCLVCATGHIKLLRKDEVYCDVHHCHRGTKWVYECDQCHQLFSYENIWLNC